MSDRKAHYYRPTNDVSETIYLDHQATTPLDPRVFEAMEPFFRESFGNPSSTRSRRGQAARRIVELAREELGAACGAHGDNFIYTSGATESNNLAILGYARANRARGMHIVVSAIEHQSVLAPARALEEEGFTVSLVPPDRDGLISREAVEAALRADTILVSVMAVNNEIGTVQPIAKIGALCADRGIAFHCDACQAIGNIPFVIDDLPVTFVSLSAHKLYGPVGVGALYVRDMDILAPRMRPLMYGGGQERNLRPGSLAQVLCVGLGRAATLAVQELHHGAARSRELQQAFLDAVKEVSGFFLNGHPTQRVATNLNIGFVGAKSELLMQEIPDIELSTISACATAHKTSSHVLEAIGLDERRMQASIRVGMGRNTRREHVERATRRIIDAVNTVRPGRR